MRVIHDNWRMESTKEATNNTNTRNAAWSHEAVTPLRKVAKETPIGDTLTTKTTGATWRMTLCP